jgi:hypothetical protein
LSSSCFRRGAFDSLSSYGSASTCSEK